MKRLVLSLLISCLPLWFFAQSISVNAEMDSACIWIGEQTKFTLSAIQPKDKQVVFPLFSDSIVNGLEIVDYCKKDTVLLPSGEIKVSESYVVTSFDSAMIFVPNMPVVDGNDTFFTNPLVLKVLSVPIDTTQHAIADIKNVVKPPFDWISFLTITAIVVLSVIVILMIIFIIRWYKKKFKKEDSECQEIVDNRPAHVIAYEQLELLRQKQLWQKSLFKEYYTDLTDILRQYIDKRFNISAMEMSSEDLIGEFKSHKDLNANKELMTLLRSILSISDLVKFAKWVPLPDENSLAFNSVTKFIDISKQEEVADKESDVTGNVDAVNSNDDSNKVSVE